MPHTGQVGVYFDSDGYRLVGTLFLARGDEPKPTAILLHGLPGHEKNYDLAYTLRDNGWNSLIFHYRGCWGSEGHYTLHTVPDDVCRAIDYVSSGNYPQIDTSRLVLVGHSFGGWAAILAAVEDPRIRAVALIAPVTDPQRLPFTAAVAKAYYTPWLHGLTPESFAEQWQALDDAWTPTRHVQKLAPRPLLILHGAADTVVPVEQSELLWAQAAEPRECHIHPDADHGFGWRRAWLAEHLLNWLGRL